eukprot:8265-Eustigmatos_ZCMA.PRE.1
MAPATAAWGFGVPNLGKQTPSSSDECRTDKLSHGPAQPHNHAYALLPPSSNTTSKAESISGSYNEC